MENNGKHGKSRERKSDTRQALEVGYRKAAKLYDALAVIKINCLLLYFLNLHHRLLHLGVVTWTEKAGGFSSHEITI